MHIILNFKKGKRKEGREGGKDLEQKMTGNKYKNISYNYLQMFKV